MNTGSGGTWFKFALVAFLAVAGLTDAARAHDADTSRLTGTDVNRASRNAFSAYAARAGDVGT